MFPGGTTRGHCQAWPRAGVNLRSARAQSRTGWTLLPISFVVIRVWRPAVGRCGILLEQFHDDLDRLLQLGIVKSLAIPLAKLERAELKSTCLPSGVQPTTESLRMIGEASGGPPDGISILRAHNLQRPN